jgi:hypothetical protein
MAETGETTVPSEETPAEKKEIETEEVEKAEVEAEEDKIEEKPSLESVSAIISASSDSSSGEEVAPPGPSAVLEETKIAANEIEELVPEKLDSSESSDSDHEEKHKLAVAEPDLIEVVSEPVKEESQVETIAPSVSEPAEIPAAPVLTQEEERDRATTIDDHVFFPVIKNKAPADPVAETAPGLEASMDLDYPHETSVTSSGAMPVDYDPLSFNTSSMALENEESIIVFGDTSISHSKGARLESDFHIVEEIEED